MKEQNIACFMLFSSELENDITNNAYFVPPFFTVIISKFTIGHSLSENAAGLTLF